MDNKIMLNTTLKYIAFILVFVGGFLGIDEIENKNNVKLGIDKFTKIGLIPLLFCAFIWHTFLGGNVMKNSSPFFEIECGGANLGIAIGLIVGYLIGIDTKSICCLLLAFLVYMIVALFCHIMFFDKIINKFMSVPFLGLLSYFIVKGIYLEN